MTATAKDEILKTLRSTSPETVPLPEPTHDWIAYEDRVQQFSTVLEAVDCAIAVRNTDEIETQLASIQAYADAKKVCSLVQGIDRANVDLNQIDDPHQLEDVDFFITCGEFGVAENAAVWVTDLHVKHRVLYFLTQHLALVLPANQILDNMHQAYDRLQFPNPGFGLFLCGPSKTADIEQSLVIGAHGARSLTVFLVDD